MRYFNVALSASLMFLLCILSVAPALAAEDTFVPYKIALGPDGNVYVSASNTVSAVNHIFVFAPDGTLVRTLDRNARNLAFDDAGNFYVVDMTPYKSGRPTIFNITRLDKSGNATVMWSNTSTSNLTVADMAVSPDGVVCFSLLSWQPGSDSYDRCDVCRIGTDGTTRVVYSENITPPGGFTTLAVDANGTIYGAGVSNRITVISPDGTTKTIGKMGSENGTFNWIYDIAIGRDGYLYVAELGNRRVQKLTTDGTFVAKWNGCGPDPFIEHFELAIDENGRVYVTDLDNRRIVWFTPGHTYGIDESENLKGQNVTWGSIYAGTNYTTQLIERQFDALQNGNRAGNDATPAPGFSWLMTLLSVALSGMALYLYRSKVQ